MALAQVSAGSRAVITDVNQFYNILKGVSGSGEAITLIYNAAGSLIFQPSSDPAAGTELIQVKNNAGTVQGSITSDGKFKSADGTAALPSHRFESEATGLFLSSAGVIGVAAQGATTNILMGLNYVSIGATPGTAGPVRLTNNTLLTWRNVANGANYTFGLTNGDHWEWTNAATRMQLTTGGDLNISTAGSTITVGTAAGGKVVTAGTLTAGGLLGSAVQVCTSGPLIYSGSNAPTISAAVKGSLYLRSDGVSNVTRMYVATDTAGTWTAVNTVA